MLFEPFTVKDFRLMQSAKAGSPIPELDEKINHLRNELGEFPEFHPDFFRLRIARRPTERKMSRLIFGKARWHYNQHWFLYNVRGDQDQVQLNIGMFPTHIRVGLGFMIGRQVKPKPPAFYVFQTLIGVRPPLPFRYAIYQCIRKNNLKIESKGKVLDKGDAGAILQELETYYIPPDDDPHFVFIGHIWKPDMAKSKQAADYRDAFRVLMPFYEELILASGRYEFFV